MYVITRGRHPTACLNIIRVVPDVHLSRGINNNNNVSCIYHVAKYGPAVRLYRMLTFDNTCAAAAASELRRAQRRKEVIGRLVKRRNEYRAGRSIIEHKGLVKLRKGEEKPHKGRPRLE